MITIIKICNVTNYLRVQSNKIIIGREEKEKKEKKNKNLRKVLKN